jgi:tripartite-type tricarboxylate transporter receptor subunit TctC
MAKTFLAVVCVGFAVATSVAAQEFPSKPVTLMMPYAAGGPGAIAGAETVSPERARPEALSAHLKAETEKWTPIIKKAGVSAD